MEALPKRKFKCLDCGAQFEEPFGKPRWFIKCPKCGSENVVREDAPQGWCGRGKGFGWWGRGRGRDFGCRRGCGKWGRAW